MRRAVFVDRDGVLNRATIRDRRPYAPRSEAEFELLPDASRGCTALKEAGFLVFVVTNQPDVGRGQIEPDVLERMHETLRRHCPVDGVLVCTHAKDGDCDCRKPRDGLLRAAALANDIDFAASYLVGDRWRDVECARNAGCTAIFVDGGYDEPLSVTPDVTVKNFGEAVQWVLSHQENASGI